MEDARDLIFGQDPFEQGAVADVAGDDVDLLLGALEPEGRSGHDVASKHRGGSRSKAGRKRVLASSRMAEWTGSASRSSLGSVSMRSIVVSSSESTSVFSEPTCEQLISPWRRTSSGVSTPSESASSVLLGGR